jgi:putative Mg2+ transporter-C (MgtC) family protein
MTSEVMESTAMDGRHRLRTISAAVPQGTRLTQEPAAHLGGFRSLGTAGTLPGSRAEQQGRETVDLSFIVDDLRTHIPETEIVVRLTMATVLGALVGIERELRDHAAGLRTHMLTAAAAALFTVLTLELHLEVREADADRIAADPIRVVEAVTAGVAFLAAGAIIHGHGTVHGLTTGAGRWLAGAIGVACGIGRFTIAIMAMVLTVIVLSVFSTIERLLLRRRSTGDPPTEHRP